MNYGNANVNLPWLVTEISGITQHKPLAFGWIVSNLNMNGPRPISEIDRELAVSKSWLLGRLLRRSIYEALIGNWWKHLGKAVLHRPRRVGNGTSSGSN